VLSSSPSSVGSSGRPATWQTERFTELGKQGPGLVLTEPVAVSARGRLHPGSPGLYEDGHVQAWSDAVEDVNDASESKTGIELFHAGQRAATQPREYGLDRPLADEDSWDIVSASATPYTRRSQTPTPMDESEMDTVRERFVKAAERADDAGFDVLQLNLAHGYLLSSFLSPLTNERDDAYGGDDIEDRLAYPLEVLDAVRAVWPDEKALTTKMPATDWRPGGNSLGDGFAIGHHLDEHGSDLLTVVAGQTTSNDRPKFDTDVLAQYSEQIRNELNVPTMTTNYVTSTDDVNTQVGAGTSDLCKWYPPTIDGDLL
jgi:anthraniloyl-CoA monooxygenase